MKLSEFVEKNHLRIVVLKNKDKCYWCDKEIKKCYANKHPNTYFCEKCVENEARGI